MFPYASICPVIGHTRKGAVPGLVYTEYGEKTNRIGTARKTVRTTTARTTIARTTTTRTTTSARTTTAINNNSQSNS